MRPVPHHAQPSHQTHPAAVLVLLTLLGAIGANPVAAQSSYAERIQRGDWEWSLEFPRAEAALLGYGTGLLRGIRHHCPVFQPDAEERLFPSSWIMAGIMGSGRQGPDLGATIGNVAAARSAIDEGEVDGALLADGDCDSPGLIRLAENASRMVSGRRPAHGGGHLRRTLAEEKVSHVRTRQMTDRTSSALMRNPRLIQLFEQDANELSRLGFQVLECHYDIDPNDGDYEVQYYWATGIASVAQVTTVLPQLVRAAQARMERFSSGMARHPFLDYGPPRSECPGNPDPQMAHKEIYAPRGAGPVVHPTTDPGEPTVEEQRNFTTYTYGAVPEGFHPPIPEIPASRTLVIKMAKQEAGSLGGLKITAGWGAEARFWPAAREIERERFRGNPRRSEIFEDDIRAARGSFVLRCGYLADSRGMLDVRFYWYRNQPANTSPERLRSRLPQHPLLNIRRPRSTCPLSPER